VRSLPRRDRRAFFQGNDLFLFMPNSLNEGWLARFSVPIVAGQRIRLRTLSDARRYVLKLRKSERDNALWRTAAQALNDAAATGETQSAEVAMRNALGNTQASVIEGET
jgi:hypothetical protein